MAKQRVDKIKRFDNKTDKALFEFVSKGGLVTEEAILKYVSKTRLSNLDHDRYFEKVPTERGDRYRLAVRGRHLAEDRWGITNHTNTKKSSTVHDCKVGDEISKVKDIASVVTEDTMWERYYQHMEKLEHEVAELEEKRLNVNLSLQEREVYAKQWHERNGEYERLSEMKKNDKISAPDFAYTNDNGELVCVEITTHNYGPEEKMCKQAMADIMGARLEFVKA